MKNSTDMTTPVTRGELRAELAKLEQKLEQKLAHLATKAEIANLATKADLETWGGALMARMDEHAKETRRALSAELARHTRSAHESSTRELAVIDEKYADLPKRVTRIEDKVFGSKPP